MRRALLSYAMAVLVAIVATFSGHTQDHEVVIVAGANVYHLRGCTQTTAYPVCRRIAGASEPMFRDRNAL